MLPPLVSPGAFIGRRSLSSAPMMKFDLPKDIGPFALNNLRANIGAHRKKKRVGRGIGSGRGRKSGRGQKGRRARAGNHGFIKHDGGSTTLQKSLPKFGDWRPRLEYCYINMWRVKEAIESGRLVVPEDRPLDVKDFFDARLVTLRQRHSGIYLLGRGAHDFDVPLKIEVQRASQSAIEAIERAGGQIELVYYSRLTLRAKLKPHRFEAAPVGQRHGQIRPRPALPPPKLMRNVYMSENKRGYLRNLLPGDVVRPQDHPEHVDLSLKYKPKYPGWDAADQQAIKAGMPFLLPDGTRASPEQIAEAQERGLAAWQIRAANPTKPRDRPYAPPPPQGKRLVRDRLLKEAEEELERKLKEE